MLKRTMLERTVFIYKIRIKQEHRCYNEQFLLIKSGSYKNTDATTNDVTTNSFY
jgi:hypothetical protein